MCVERGGGGAGGQGGRDGAVARALASHQCGPGLICRLRVVDSHPGFERFFSLGSSNTTVTYLIAQFCELVFQSFIHRKEKSNIHGEAVKVKNTNLHGCTVCLMLTEYY